MIRRLVLLFPVVLWGGLACTTPSSQSITQSETMPTTQDQGDYRALEAARARERDAAAFTRKAKEEKKKHRRRYRPLESPPGDSQGVIDQPLGPRF